MGAFSIWHWLVVLVIVLVLFGGRGKISSLMGDLGKGLKAFKSNIKEDSQGTTEKLTADQAETSSSTSPSTSPSEQHSEQQK